MHIDWTGSGQTVMKRLPLSLFPHTKGNNELLVESLNEACKMFPLSVLKIIRATLDLIVQFLFQNQDIQRQTKIIVLIRDPRSVMLVMHPLMAFLKKDFIKNIGLRQGTSKRIGATGNRLIAPALSTCASHMSGTITLPDH